MDATGLVTDLSGRALHLGPQRLLEVAQQSCERTRRVIAESREIVACHRDLVRALRASTAPGALRSVPRLEVVETPPTNGEAAPAFDLDEEVAVGALRLLPLRRAVIGGGARVLLTPCEWQLLVALVTHQARTVTRTELATTAWGPGFASRHGEVEVYISRLRRKLARCGNLMHIQTVRGQGYRLRLDHDAEGVA
jgi:DNA-binding response OmpR family regulator